MVRRTPPQRKTDEQAFPIRVKFVVPPFGTARVAPEMHLWLKEEVGRGRFAVHSTDALFTDAFAVHFVELDDAQAFMQAHPTLELADVDVATF